MMSKPELHIADDREATARDFAEFLKEATRDKDSFSIALSGGSTPKVLFDILSADYNDQINWEALRFYWGDERCVPPDHEESNYRMTHEHLFSKINVPENNIHRVRGEEDPVREAARYGELIMHTLPITDHLPRFDLVILGMGDDGHTASIFPHESFLLEDQGICAIAHHPESGQKRVTLTGPVINNAAVVAFLVTGAGKKEKVGEVINRTGNWKSYPASHIQPGNGDLHWFLDKAAASLI